MTDDLLAPYAIDKSLTEEERRFIEELKTIEGGATILESMRNARVCLKKSWTGRVHLSSDRGNPVDPDYLLQHGFLWFSDSLIQQDQASLALGAAGLGLRVGLLALRPEDQYTLSCRMALGVSLKSLSRLEESLAILKSVRADSERILGRAHPATLTASANICMCLRSMEVDHLDLPFLEQSLADCSRILGNAHRGTLLVRITLARSLLSKGRADKTLEILEGSLVNFEKTYGPDHEYVFECRLLVAACQITLGYPNKAMLQCESILRACENAHGSRHNQTLRCQRVLASCLKQLGRRDEALALTSRVFEETAKAMGPDDSPPFVVRTELAQGLLASGRADEALSHAERALAEVSTVMGPAQPRTLESRDVLAQCLSAIGRFEEALSLYELNLTMRESHLGSEHVDTLTSRHNLALCYRSVGREEDARKHFKAAMGESARVLGPGHPFTLDHCHGLALCLEALGREDSACAYWQILAKHLPACSQPDERWLNLLLWTVIGISRHARAGNLSDWEAYLGSLSSSLLEAIDLESPEQMATVRSKVAQFYAIYLDLSVDLDRHDLIPRVLAARQGRKLAALILEQLEVTDHSPEPGSPRGRFQQLRLELRQLALGLQVIGGGSGLPGEGGLDVADVDAYYARKYKQMQVYKEKLGVYRELKTELEATDPDFSVSASALEPQLPELQARLEKSEGLVLLFEREGNDTEPVTQLAQLITRAGSVLVPLFDTQLHQGAGLATAWHVSLFSRAGMRYVGSRDAVTRVGSPSENEGLFSDLTVALRTGLWAPLAEHLGSLRRLHLVTHGNWHLMPVELGAPENLELACYPGFVYYHRLRHQDAMPGMSADQQLNQYTTVLAPDGSTALGLSVNAAEDIPGLEPIPFVRAESHLIRALWPGPVHFDPDLDANKPTFGVLQVAAHGQADERDPARANVILGNRVLDFHVVVGARQHPPVVVLSACTVGRTMDDPDGEPLGLVGGFLLKGTRYVIASLQPVPDFYMPLLITLYYQAWPQFGVPNRALEEAKHRLKQGIWYPQTAELVRCHYKPVIEQVLTDVQQKSGTSDWSDPLLQLTHVWTFPHPFRMLHPDEDQHTLADLHAAIKSESGRSEIADLILDTLISERGKLPQDVVDTLCTWVRGFGDCAAAV